MVGEDNTGNSFNFIQNVSETPSRSDEKESLHFYRQRMNVNENPLSKFGREEKLLFSLGDSFFCYCWSTLNYSVAINYLPTYGIVINEDLQSYIVTY